MKADKVIMDILATHGYPIEEAEDILNNAGRAIYQAGIREVVETALVNPKRGKPRLPNGTDED